VFFVTDKLLFATSTAEADQLKRVPGLVGGEDDWYTAALGYIVSPHCIVAVGVGNFGNVANHDEPFVRPSSSSGSSDPPGRKVRRR